MKRFIPLIFLLVLQLSLLAQKPATVTSADIYLGLRKLNVLGSVLYIAAHPDDENTRLLTYFAKDRLYRTGYLSLTRGDGGQNLIGDEQGIELGMIRTQELLAARRLDGAEQFFTRAFDFGFSKNPEETFTKWNREKILSDVVWVIRRFKPDVIITRFPTTGEGGHGHHTASAILANEAFEAAADSKRFPEQLKYVEAWQVKRVLWNGFNFNNNTQARPDQLRMDVGGYNAVLGKGYGEIAAESRSQHKSQGFGVAASRGEAFENFSTTKGTAPVNDIMDGVAMDWKRVKGGEKIEPLVEKIISSFDFLSPQKSVQQLVQLSDAIRQLPVGAWRTQKLDEVQQLIAWCSGVWMEAVATTQNAVQGDSLRINFFVNNRNGAPGLKLTNVSVESFDSTLNAALPANKNINFSKTIFVPYTKEISQPYWLKEKMEEGIFNIKDQQIIGQPDVSPAFITKFNFEVEGKSFSYTVPVRYKFTDPVRGEVYQPVFVLPTATIVNNPHLIILRKGEKQQRPIFAQLTANKKLNSNAAGAALQLNGFKGLLQDSALSLEKGGIRNFSFSLSQESGIRHDTAIAKTIAHYKIDNRTEQISQAMKAIRYEHIPDIKYFYSDDIKVVNTDLKTVGKRIGYIVGAGDKVPESLEEMGYEVSLLSDKELARNNLAQFDAIITGVRAYNTNEWMNAYYDKLMKYVSEGGNLIVQYNTSTQIGPIRARIAPYSFNISRTRVTDENAAVTFLKAEHPVLNYPNKITQEDFKGWIQERSTYHAADLDKNFETILSMNDPGEQPDGGSLVIAKYGKGYFSYTGLVFFRELPAGVPGAYRLIANLIALNSKKAF